MSSPVLKCFTTGNQLTSLQVRSSLAESGELFKQLVDLLRHPPFRQIVLKLLYQFTRDDRCKSLLTYHQDCLVMLLQLIVSYY